MRLITGFACLSAIFLFACSSPSTPSESLTYPLDTRTGISEIDPVLAAVESRDPQKLRDLIQYTSAPCTWKDGLGGPPKCRQGEVEGTMLEVLPYLGSEGSFIRKSEIDNWPGIDASALYAVLGIAENAVREQYYLPGDYVAFFLQKGDQPGVGLHITDGRIVRVDTMFNGSSDPFAGFIGQDSLDPSKVILAPKTR
jgi:hypothetical protein